MEINFNIKWPGFINILLFITESDSVLQFCILKDKLRNFTANFIYVSNTTNFLRGGSEFNSSGDTGDTT